MSHNIEVIQEVLTKFEVRETIINNLQLFTNLMCFWGVFGRPAFCHSPGHEWEITTEVHSPLAVKCFKHIYTPCKVLLQRGVGGAKHDENGANIYS